jgi:hypothetical protein
MDGCQVSRLNKKIAQGPDEENPYACEPRWPQNYTSAKSCGSIPRCCECRVSLVALHAN